MCKYADALQLLLKPHVPHQLMKVARVGVLRLSVTQYTVGQYQIDSIQVNRTANHQRRSLKLKTLPTVLLFIKYHAHIYSLRGSCVSPPGVIMIVGTACHELHLAEWLE